MFFKTVKKISPGSERKLFSGQKDQEKVFLIVGFDLDYAQVLVFSSEQSAGVKKIVFLSHSESRLEIDSGKLDPSLFISGKAGLFFGSSGQLPLKIFKQRIGEIIDQALAGAEKAKGKKIILKNIEAIVSLSPSLLRFLLFSFSHKRTLPEKAIEALEEKEIFLGLSKKAEEEKNRLAADIGALDSDLKITGLKAIEEKINGYKVSGLSGRKGSDIEITAGIGVLPATCLEEIGQIFKQNNYLFGKLSVIGLGEIIANIPLSGLNCLFLEIGRDWTELFFVKNGKIDKIVNSESGSNLFLKAVADRKRVGLSEAKMAKNAYLEGLLSDQEREEMGKILSQAAEEWLLGLKTAISGRDFPGKSQELLLSQFNRFAAEDLYLLGEAGSMSEVQEKIRDNYKNLFVFSPKMKLLNFSLVAGWLAENKQKIIIVDSGIKNKISGKFLLISIFNQKQDV